MLNNVKYRESISALAASVYHVQLETPGEDSSQKDHEKYVNFVRVVEKHVTLHASKLSKKYSIPVDVIHRDILNYVDLLPKEDLKQSYIARKQNRLN